MAAASNSIEGAIGERYPLPVSNGEEIYDYSLVICVFGAGVLIYNILVTSIGLERKEATLGEMCEDEHDLEGGDVADAWNV